MRKLPIAAAILATLFCSIFCSPAARAQDSVYFLGRGFDASKNVVQLDFPDQMDGVGVVLVWRTAKGQFTKKIDARAGLHAYEMRDVPGWDGHVELLAISAPGVDGQARVPNLSDEIDMTFAPQPVREETVNLLEGHTLFAWSWNAWLLVVVVLVALGIFAIRKTPLVPSLLLGFLVAWGVMDLRAVYDHWMIASRTEQYVVGHGGIFPLGATRVFAEFASRIIGPATWSDASIGLVNGSYLRYRLAEHPYVPPASGRIPDLLITPTPKGDPVVFQYGGYFLVKPTRR